MLSLLQLGTWSFSKNLLKPFGVDAFLFRCMLGLTTCLKHYESWIKMSQKRNMSAKAKENSQWKRETFTVHRCPPPEAEDQSIDKITPGWWQFRKGLARVQRWWTFCSSMIYCLDMDFERSKCGSLSLGAVSQKDQGVTTTVTAQELTSFK